MVSLRSEVNKMLKPQIIIPIIVQKIASDTENNNNNNTKYNK